MSVVGSQQRTFLHLLSLLRPHWHQDRNLPARIQSLLALNRSFGSRDRRLYRELIYTTLRYLPWIEPLLDSQPEPALQITAWLAAETRATASFRAALIADWPPCPSTVSAKTQELLRRFTFRFSELLPEWFRSHCPAAFVPKELDTLLRRAPLWLRLQTVNRTEVTDEFDERGWRWAQSDILPDALQILDEMDVTLTHAYSAGMVEVQDLGSQCVLESVGLARGGTWLDACAGAGGKTLQLAQLLGPTGRVDAFDIRPSALRELAARAQRAGLGNISILPAPPVGKYHGVLIDAPCSGTGTWRRAPHLQWTTSEPQIAEAALVQASLLEKYCSCVSAGGWLLYATCSLSRRENEEVVGSFLTRHPDFQIEPPARNFGAVTSAHGLTLLPSLHNHDGFYVAALRRRSS
jgi:16S rRNA (cytosine967-C5)-methyltransferase